VARVRQVIRASRDSDPAPGLPELGPRIGLPARYDRFELHELLGRGGFSTVYRGLDPTGQEVAIKLFSGDVVENRVSLGRFFREVATLRNVDSPGIVPVLGSGFAQGRFYIAMKLILGLSAGELLHEFGPFEIEEACRLGRDVANALHKLSQHGLVHRDVKPANIMIQPEGQCVLVDFGLAKGHEDISITSSGELIGTGPYLAPEVIRGPGADSLASDLYSLGATVYQLLSGKLPFEGEGHVLFRAIVSGPPPPGLASLRPELPSALVALVESLMCPDSSKRLSDGLEAAARFDAFTG
jgi:serine/threonine-protein kinase